jgi:hypothetical protein
MTKPKTSTASPDTAKATKPMPTKARPRSKPGPAKAIARLKVAGAAAKPKTTPGPAKAAARLKVPKVAGAAAKARRKPAKRTPRPKLPPIPPSGVKLITVYEIAAAWNVTHVYVRTHVDEGRIKEDFYVRHPSGAIARFWLKVPARPTRPVPAPPAPPRRIRVRKSSAGKGDATLLDHLAPEELAS